MKTIKEFINVCILNSNQLKLIKSGTAPDCEGGQILNLYTRECVTEEEIEGHISIDNCINGLP